MQFRIPVLLVAATASLGHAAQIENSPLVISEVLYNEVGSSVTGEWIEIYNRSATTIDLSNYKIGEEETQNGTGTTESMWQFPAGATIAPGAVQVIANDADAFAGIYAFLPTYETNGSNADVPNLSIYAAWDPDGATLNFANSTEQAVLLSPTDEQADALSWGSTFAFSPGLADAEVDGQSYARINGTADTNTADDWALVTAPPEGAFHTSFSNPGIVAVPEPAGLALIGLGALAAVRRRRSR